VIGGVVERYPGAQQRDFDGNPEVTEMDALVAYLQMLGTLVDFSTFTPEEAGEPVREDQTWKIPTPSCGSSRGAGG
jgi:hypothetical protein